MDNRRQSRLIAFLALLAGFAIAGVAAWQFQKNPSSPNNRAVLVGVAVFLIVDIIVIATFLGVRASKNRRKEWEAKADTLGDAVDLDFNHEPPKEFHHDFLFLPEIKKSGKTNHLATGEIAGRQATFFEHAYVVSTGETTYTVSHCVYTTDAPHWPDLTVRMRNLFSQFFFKLGRRKGLLLDDPKFNLAFVVECDDEPFAVTILTPAIQTFMLEKPTVRWRITQGRVFLIYRGALKLDRMPSAVDRLSRFWSHVPPEVEAWQSLP